MSSFEDNDQNADGSESRRIDLAREPDFDLGSVTVQPALRLVKGPLGEETLEPRVMQVLVALSDPSSPIYTRDDLIERCWDGRIVGETSINRAISLVRNALRAVAGEAVSIETVPKIGYRMLIADQISPTDAQNEASPIEAGSLSSATARSPDQRDAISSAQSLKAPFPKAAVLAALALAMCALGVFYFWPKDGSDQNETLRVTVLPLAAAQGVDLFYASGFDAEIRKQLVSQLPVEISVSESARQLSESGLSPAEVGAKLGTDYVWSGELETDDKTLTLRWQLIATADTQTAWDETITSAIDAAEFVPVRLARSLAPTLGVVAGSDAFEPDLSGAEFDLYVLAMGLIRTREPDQIATATRMLEGLTETNPDSAQALAGLAKAVFLTYDADGERYRASRRRAKDLANAALERDPDLVEALKVAGFLAEDTNTRIAILNRATQLDGGDAEAHFWSAGVQWSPEWIAQRFDNAERVVQLDPLWANSIGAINAIASEGYRDKSNELNQLIELAAAEPWQSDLARSRIAKVNGDWSEYLRLREASNAFLSSAEANQDWSSYLTVRRLLDLMQEAAPTGKRGDVWTGKLPSLAQLESQGYTPDTFWSDQSRLRAASIPLFLRDGREDDLLSLFDAQFSSAATFEEELSALPDGQFEVPYAASYLAVAMDRSDRNGEAKALRSVARRYVDEWQEKAAQTVSAAFLEATLAASAKDADGASEALRKMIALGWPFAASSPIWGNAGPLSDDALWADQAIRAAAQEALRDVQADLARERSETLSQSE